MVSTPEHFLLVVEAVLVSPECPVEESSGGDVPVNAGGILFEAILSDSVELLLEVVNDGVGDVQVSESLNLSASESTHDLSNSGSAVGVGEGVRAGPDGRVGVVSSVEVAVVDVVSDVESDKTKPICELVGSCRNKVRAEVNILESVSEDSALLVGSEAAALGVHLPEGDVEALEVSGTIRDFSVLEESAEVSVADSGNVEVESGVLEVLNSEEGDESPNLSQKGSVGLGLLNESVDTFDDIDSSLGLRAEAFLVFSRLELSESRLDEERILVSADSGNINSVSGGEEGIDSGRSISAGGSVEGVLLEGFRERVKVESASLEEVCDDGVDVVVLNSRELSSLDLLQTAEEGGEDLGGGELAELVGVVVAGGVGLVVKESVLEVSKHGSVCLNVREGALEDVGSLDQVGDPVRAVAWVSTDGGDSHQEEEGNV